MICDCCKKECGKFYYSIPQGTYKNKEPWALCSLKCIKEMIKGAKNGKK